MGEEENDRKSDILLVVVVVCIFVQIIVVPLRFSAFPVPRKLRSCRGKIVGIVSWMVDE